MRARPAPAHRRRRDHERARGRDDPLHGGAELVERAEADLDRVAALAERHLDATSRGRRAHPAAPRRRATSGGGALRVELVGVHHHGGAQVGGLALGEQGAQLREPRLGVEAREQRPRGGVAEPRGERLEARAQVDQRAAREQALRRAWLRRGAAAERDHGALAGHRLDRLALALAEACLAFAGEQLRDAASRAALDLAVEIDERAREPRREQSAHRGLARPHHPHQPDGAVAHGGRITQERGREQGLARSAREPGLAPRSEAKPSEVAVGLSCRLRGSPPRAASRRPGAPGALRASRCS